MKNLLIFCACAGMLLGCSKDKNKILTPDQALMELIYRNYKDTVGLKLYSYREGVCDDLIVIPGLKNGKLWLGFFEPKAEEVVGLTNYVRLVYQKTYNYDIIGGFSTDVGYGEKEWLSLVHITVTGITNNQTQYFKIILQYQNRLGGLAMPQQNHLFITDNGKTPIIDTNFAFECERMVKWGENKVLLFKIGNIVNGKTDMCIADDSGHKEYLQIYRVFFGLNYISDDIGILDFKYVYDLRTSTNLATVAFTGIPNNARFDKFTNTKTENGLQYFKVDITLYSGEKLVRNIAISQTTGIITYLD